MVGEVCVCACVAVRVCASARVCVGVGAGAGVCVCWCVEGGRCVCARTYKIAIAVLVCGRVPHSTKV